MLETIIGFTAAFLTTFAGIPQLIKILKHKHTKDISLEMYIMLCVGVFLWFVYGIFRKDIVLITANIVSLLVNGLILVYKIRYK